MCKIFAIACAALSLGACTLGPGGYDGDNHSYRHFASDEAYSHIAGYDGTLAQERGLAALILIGSAAPDSGGI